MKTTFSCLSFLLSTAAFAQEAPPPDAAADSSANTIIVTATRAPTTIDKVSSSVTVLDKLAIDRAQDIGVTEQLLRTPSVSIARNGGYGETTSLRIRGAEAEQTVLVIDGVKFSDPASTANGPNFANLLVGDVSRIEVLRGPQSILWGSQAIGGVVNIVTPMPTRPLEANIDIEAGSRETVNARAALGGKAGPVAWRIGATAFSTGGISAIAPAFGGVEPDGYTSKNVTGRLEWTISNALSAEVRGYYSNDRNQFDATTGDDPEFGTTEEYIGYAGINLSLLGGRLRNRLGYDYTDTIRDNYDPRRDREATFDSTGHNRRIEYQGTFAITKGWNAVFGIEHEVSTMSTVSPPASRATPIPAPTIGRARLMGFYGQINATIIEGLTLNAGVRHDDHTDFGGKTLFQTGGVWALKTGTTLRANYDEGFKAPSLYQLYSVYGNTALAPEQAKGWEAGADQKLFDGRISIGATYYQRRSINLIAFVSCAAGSTLPICYQPGTSISRFGYYQNVSRAFAQGIELVASAHPVQQLTIDGNYSWNLAEDRSPGSATYGYWLARRPRKEANGSISYDWPFGLTTGAAIRWAGHSFDNAANTTRLDSYTLVDLRAEYKIVQGLTLFGRVENLFNETYYTAYRYGSLGRSIYAGFRGRF